MQKHDPERIMMLSKAAKDFSTSQLGRHLIAKAEAEERELLNDLVEADPNDAAENAQIRNQIHATRMFRRWINETLAAGDAMKAMLTREDAAARDY